MKAVVIGCGRVGSAVAKGLALDGWEVTAVDENEDALNRLGPAWRGGFVVGHGMDTSVLERAGVADADAAVVSTDGDNTNLVIGQVLQRRYEIATVVVGFMPTRTGPRTGTLTISSSEGDLIVTLTGVGLGDEPDKTSFYACDCTTSNPAGAWPALVVVLVLRRRRRR